MIRDGGSELAHGIQVVAVLGGGAAIWSVVLATSLLIGGGPTWFRTAAAAR